ncbi:uncharacterized protein [Diabrotica undecimpunctata]|uniref:uncharacterized protein n=1 Tax=Diabrotica undecimpunctata TaxID=50387 RepID=UPI003B63EDE9
MRTVQLYFILAFCIFTVSTAPVPDVEDDVLIDHEELVDLQGKTEDAEQESEDTETKAETTLEKINDLVEALEEYKSDQDGAKLDAVIAKAQDAKSASEEVKDEATEAKNAAALANEAANSIAGECSDDVVIDAECEEAIEAVAKDAGQLVEDFTLLKLSKDHPKGSHEFDLNEFLSTGLFQAVIQPCHNDIINLFNGLF